MLYTTQIRVARPHGLLALGTPTQQIVIRADEYIVQVDNSLADSKLGCQYLTERNLAKFPLNKIWILESILSGNKKFFQKNGDTAAADKISVVLGELREYMGSLAGIVVSDGRAATLLKSGLFGIKSPTLYMNLIKNFRKMAVNLEKNYEISKKCFTDSNLLNMKNLRDLKTD